MEDKFYFVAEYQAVPDPTKQEKAKNWDVAIGLQMVDGKNENLRSGFDIKQNCLTFRI